MRNLTDIFSKLGNDNVETLDGIDVIDDRLASQVVHFQGQSPDSLCKLLYRDEHLNGQRKAKLAFDNEIRVLLHLRNTFGDKAVPTPHLIGAPIALDTEKYFAAYQMTRLQGGIMEWGRNETSEDHSSQFKEQYFESLGASFARFHYAVKDLQGVPHDDMPWGSDVKEVPALSQKTNTLLRKANTYLKAHAKAGVAHGDTHCENALYDDHGMATGLLDFSEARSTSNLAFDFINIPNEFLTHFLNGYEAESGEHVDIALMQMMQLSRCAYFLYDAYQEKSDFPNRSILSASRELNVELEKAEAILSY